MRHVAAAALLMASVLANFPAGAETTRPLLVGGGEVTGYYYPAAGALCRVINKEVSADNGCAVIPSSGSAANLASLRSGAVDMAVVQAEAAREAVAGTGAFKDAGLFAELRALMSLHGESVLVLARQGAEVESMADLRGKRVNLGRPGSFQRAMAEAVLEAVGLTEGDLAPAVELELSEQTPELCEGNIDVAFYAGVHPMAEAEMAVGECDAQPIAIKAKTVESYLKRHPALSHATISRAAYDGMKSDVASLQVRALLVTTTRLGSDRAYDLLKAVHANFTALTHLHPVLRGLNKAESAHEGIAIPFHDGADKFYGETGLK